MSAAPTRPDEVATGVPGGHSEAAAARLLIRAGSGTRLPKATDLKALWQWWLGGATPPAHAPDSARLRVEVAAEQGRCLFVLRDPQGTVEVTVGPGTYDITVVIGRHKRRYTVPLAPGATFDLDLHDAMQGA